MSTESIKAPKGYRFKQVDEHTVELEAEQLATVRMPGDLEWSQENVLPKKCTYAEAEAACKALGPGWRLPTVKELVGLVDYSRHSPAIDIVAFPNCKCDCYWTSTIYAPNPACAWFVYFGYGYAYCSHRDSNLAFLRAVRSVAPGQ